MLKLKLTSNFNITEETESRKMDSDTILIDICVIGTVLPLLAHPAY
jgi:hypothetical protein